MNIQIELELLNALKGENVSLNSRLKVSETIQNMDPASRERLVDFLVAKVISCGIVIIGRVYFEINKNILIVNYFHMV